MTPEIEAALAAGATTLVNTAATDAWKLARAGFARLFGRGEQGREEVAERRLDALEAEVRQAPADDRAEIRERERAKWLVRLTDLAEDDPAVLADLRTLVGELTARLPAEQQNWVQTNIARDNSQVFAAQGGNIHVHQDGPVGGVP